MISVRALRVAVIGSLPAKNRLMGVGCFEGSGDLLKLVLAALLSDSRCERLVSIRTATDPLISPDRECVQHAAGWPIQALQETNDDCLLIGC